MRPVTPLLDHKLTNAVNEILGDHNIDKQMTDSRDEVRNLCEDLKRQTTNNFLGGLLDSRYQRCEQQCH